MPVCTPERRPVHVSAKKCIRYPYRTMPRIRSTVHPCFVLRLLARYRFQDVNLEYAASPISTDDSIRSLLSEIAIVASSCVNLSWLHGTWYDFPERGVAVARPDPKPLARESAVAKEEVIHTDEERNPRRSSTRRSSGEPLPTTTLAPVGKQKRLASALPEKRQSKRLQAASVPIEREARGTTIDLSQITTDPQSATVEKFNFIAKDELGLDGLEYHLGLSRGEIVRYRNLPSMSTSLRADMAELLGTCSWALLPSTPILRTILDLYKFNHDPSTATDQRKLFTDVLPNGVYEYELMPVCTADRLPVHVAGKGSYKYPYHDMPRIRSSVHPCFVLRVLLRYRQEPTSFNYAPNPISKDPSLCSLLSQIFVTATFCVNLSWLHGTWYDFPERGVAVARRDTKPLVPEEEEEEEEEIHTDEERNLEDPRLVLARYKLLKYMATHNTRIGSRVPPSTTALPPAGNVQERLASDAAPPTAGSSADVPGKRKRSSSASDPKTVFDEPEKRRSKRLMLARKP